MVRVHYAILARGVALLGMPLPCVAGVIRKILHLFYLAVGMDGAGGNGAGDGRSAGILSARGLAGGAGGGLERKRRRELSHNITHLLSSILPALHSPSHAAARRCPAVAAARSAGRSGDDCCRTGSLSVVRCVPLLHSG